MLCEAQVDAVLLEGADMQARDVPSVIPVVDTDLLEHYDRPGPRYTSYPTAMEFHDGFAHGDYAPMLAAR